MTTHEYKLLSDDEKVNVVNARLSELQAAGQTTKDFKNEIYNFSYTFAMRLLSPLGYRFRNNQIVQEKLTVFQSNTDNTEILTAQEHYVKLYSLISPIGEKRNKTFQITAEKEEWLNKLYEQLPGVNKFVIMDMILSIAMEHIKL